MTSKAPERSRETKEKLAENSLTILTELGKLIKQSNKNSSSQEVLLKSAKLFCSQENCLQNLSNNLSSVNKLLTNIESQAILTCQSAELIDSELKEAYRRIDVAVTLDGKGNYQEAYKIYLTTTNYITNILESRLSSEDWCNEKSEKLLGYANMCIEAAIQINKTRLKKYNAITHVTSPTFGSTASNNNIMSEESNTELLPHSCADLISSIEDDDLLSILDSLPEVPKTEIPARLNRSATLPILPKASSRDRTPPYASTIHSRTSQTLPKNLSLQKPRSASLHNTASDKQSAPGTRTGDTLSAPVVLTVSHLDRAKEQNVVLAAKYEQRAQKRTLRPQERLEFFRAQEENRMIAQEQEKMLFKKCEERKLRLEEKVISQEVQSTIGNFEIILYGKADQMRMLILSIREYDTQCSNCTEPDLEDKQKMEQIMAWCLDESSHPINIAVGEAQLDFYNRITPLNKKMFLATPEERLSLLPGVKAEAEAITIDIKDFLWNLAVVLCNIYRIFYNEEGEKFLRTSLSNLFFKPFLKPLIEVYSFVKHSDLSVFEEYLRNHAEDDITSFTQIKPRYCLGEDPYEPAVQALRDVLDSNSPIHKLSLLVSFGQLVSSSIKHFYINSGKSEEDSTKLSDLGADDLVPITDFIVTRLNRSDLVSQLQLLYDITPQHELLGSEGYCLTTVHNAVQFVINRENERNKKENECQSDHKKGLE